RNLLQTVQLVPPSPSAPSQVPQAGTNDRTDFHARHFCANETLEKIATPHRQSGRSGYSKSGIQEGHPTMLRATKDIKLPTTITGSLPRPGWFTESLGARTFLDAMVDNRFR